MHFNRLAVFLCVLISIAWVSAQNTSIATSQIPRASETTTNAPTTTSAAPSTTTTSEQSSTSTTSSIPITFITRTTRPTTTTSTTDATQTPTNTASASDASSNGGLSETAKRALIITGSVVGAILFIALAVLFYHKCIKGEDANGEVHSGYTVPRPIKKPVTATKPFDNEAPDTNRASQSTSTLYMQGSTTSMNNPYVYLPANTAVTGAPGAYYVAAPQQYYVDGYPVHYASTTAPMMAQPQMAPVSNDTFYQQQPQQNDPYYQQQTQQQAYYQ